MKNNKFTYFNFLPSFSWLFIFSFLPLIIVVIYSLVHNLRTSGASIEFTGIYYINFFSRNSLLFLFRTISTSFIVSLSLLFLSLPFVYYLDKNPKYSKLFLILILIPFLTNTLLRLYSITFLFRDSGLINSLLGTEISFLYNEKATIISFVYIYFPYMVLPLYNAFQEYNKSYHTISNDIGMDTFSYLKKIKLPIMWKGIFNSFSLVFLLTVGDFLIPQIIGGAKKLYFSNVIFNYFTKGLNWSKGAANSVLLIILSLTFLFVLNVIARKILQFKQSK